MVPSAAVVQRDGHSYVFTMKDQQVVQRLRVRTGQTSQGLVEVIEGLKPGDRVVAKGAGFLGDGDRVRVVSAAAAGAGAQ
jgi:multidrug efflux pump subunit AcrA (membrane-fusion protein)